MSKIQVQGFPAYPSGKFYKDQDQDANFSSGSQKEVKTPKYHRSNDLVPEDTKAAKVSKTPKLTTSPLG